MNQSKRLYRSTTQKMIAGVCGGIAEYFDVDPTLIRAAFVVMAFGGGFGFFAYLVLWVIIPEAATADQPIEVRAETAGKQIEQAAQGFASKVQGSGEKTGRVLLGVGLVIIGFLALAKIFFPWKIFEWDHFWPLLLVAIGVVIIFRKK